jgi:hypothetical protein
MRYLIFAREDASSPWFVIAESPDHAVMFDAVRGFWDFETMLLEEDQAALDPDLGEALEAWKARNDAAYQTAHEHEELDFTLNDTMEQHFYEQVDSGAITGEEAFERTYEAFTAGRVERPADARERAGDLAMVTELEFLKAVREILPEGSEEWRSVFRHLSRDFRAWSVHEFKGRSLQ